MFEPRVALASLSGVSDAAWARDAEGHVGAAFLGGIALCEGTRAAARRMVADRDREEFLPTDPLAFVDDELSKLDDAPLRAAVNVRSAERGPLRQVGEICADHGAICELNAHCRQPELCTAGVGETLLRDVHRLCEGVEIVAETGATVSVKVRAEVPEVDLIDLASWIEGAGASAIHVDAMDSEAVIREVRNASDLFVIANNGVRDRETATEYLRYGANAVSVGRPSDDPAVLRAVRETTDAWFEGRNRGERSDDRDGDRTHRVDADADVDAAITTEAGTGTDTRG